MRLSKILGGRDSGTPGQSQRRITTERADELLGLRGFKRGDRPDGRRYINAEGQIVLLPPPFPRELSAEEERKIGNANRKESK